MQHRTVLSILHLIIIIAQLLSVGAAGSHKLDINGGFSNVAITNSGDP